MKSSGSYWDTEWGLSEVIPVFRAEKESSAYDTMDYTVLSVVVATLGLILFVELIRHKFDELARGRPFFEELIACVNSECKLDCLGENCFLSSVALVLIPSQWLRLVLSSLSFLSFRNTILE